MSTYGGAIVAAEHDCDRMAPLVVEKILSGAVGLDAYWCDECRARASLAVGTRSRWCLYCSHPSGPVDGPNIHHPACRVFGPWFCSICVDGQDELLPAADGKLECWRCRHEHPRGGGYTFAGGVDRSRSLTNPVHR